LEAGNTGQEAMVFDTPCYSCGKMGKNRMCTCEIPHFKEIIIMCFDCEHCGYKHAEVKGGGGISEKAKRLILTVQKPEDLDRDMYKVFFHEFIKKSDACGVRIPEVGLEITQGSMGGVYTTVEGIIEKIHDNLKKCNPFGIGDSAENAKYQEFLGKLLEVFFLEVNPIKVKNKITIYAYFG